MEGIRGMEHPLQTPVVLECIFKNLDYYYLQQCRMVCRTWRDESRKAMRAQATVEILCGGRGQRGPSKFLELVETDESTFFEAPFADTFTLRNGVADCPEFWEACGVHIKYLRLHDVTFSSVDTFRQAIFKLCPNLKELKLMYVGVCGEPVPEPKEWISPQFIPNMNLKTLSFSDFRNGSMGWLEILSQFPCLEELNVREMRGRFADVFRALEVARQHDATSWKLKEVVLFGGGIPFIPVPPAFARLFGNGDFTLTSLTMQGIAIDTAKEVTAVEKILVAHAHSLKKLSICQNSDDPLRFIFPLPGKQVFEHVQALEFFGLKIRSTRFLQAFPNLKTISLDVAEIPEDIQTPHVMLEHCTQLICHNRIVKNDDFKRLFGLLPNLKKLQIFYLDNEKFSLICEICPDLTHLELAENFRLNDAGISGYDQKDARKINNRGRRRPWRPTTVRRANLSSLKSLQCFSWRLSSEECSKVGYCTEACGILELPQLKQLRVEREYGDSGLLSVFESISGQFPWDGTQKIMFD